MAPVGVYKARVRKQGRYWFGWSADGALVAVSMHWRVVLSEVLGEPRRLPEDQRPLTTTH